MAEFKGQPGPNEFIGGCMRPIPQLLPHRSTKAYPCNWCGVGSKKLFYDSAALDTDAPELVRACAWDHAVKLLEEA